MSISIDHFNCSERTSDDNHDKDDNYNDEYNDNCAYSSEPEHEIKLAPLIC